MISANIFNPKRKLFVINLQNPHFFINRDFRTTDLHLNESYLDFISFELEFIKEGEQSLNIGSLDFKIELDLHEN